LTCTTPSSPSLFSVVISAGRRERSKHNSSRKQKQNYRKPAKATKNRRSNAQEKQCVTNLGGEKENRRNSDETAKSSLISSLPLFLFLA
jgi:hypothetical protein